MIRDLSVEKINDKTCEFKNMIRGSAKGKRMDFLSKTRHSWELLQAAREPLLEAHNSQERLLFAKGIERHAFGGK
jgi:hypothetical protein